MKREEAIEILNALAWVQGGPDREEIITAISMAIEALSADVVSRDIYDKRIQTDEKIIDNYRQEFQKVLSAEAVQGVGKYENAIQKLREMPRYLNGIKKKQITKISAEVVPLSVVDKISEECERLEDRVAELEEQLTEAVSCEPLDIFARNEPAEVVRGEWIKTVDGNGWNEWYVFKCPFCGATIEDKQYRPWEYNFCPNCRADMRGEVK